MDTETFGEYIRRIRETKGLTLKELSESLEIDQSTLSKIERNERRLTTKLLDSLSNALDLDPKKTRVKFFSDKITLELYPETDSLEILKVAEKRLKYLKSNK